MLNTQSDEDAMLEHSLPNEGGNNEEEEEEDATLWIPLAENQNDISSHPSASVPPIVQQQQQQQRRLEYQTKLRTTLVDHPLHQFWGLFCTHTINEIWDLELHIRLGVVLVVAGVVFQWIVLVLSVPWYHPQVLLLLLVLGASVVYLKPDNVDRQLRALGSILTSPTLVLDVFENLSERDVRHVLYAALWCPTVFGMHTIGFLSTCIVESGWTYTTLTTLLAFAVALYRKQLSQQPPKDSTTTTRTTTRTTSPKDDVTTVVLVMYASALVACLFRLSLYHIPFLAARFCLSTGTLLLYREESEWLSGALRQALRYTLRDVLVHLGTHVQQDEMLQLAMLRWIVDYWSYQPTEHAVDNDTEPSTTTNDMDATGAAGTPSELQWDDLLPMLTATTEQMEQEAQSPPSPPPSPTENASGGGDDDTADTPETESSSHNPSLENLKSMLSRMNLDESARPAVESYRRAVQNFPPSRARALLVAISRRCPAILLLCVRYVTGVSAFFSSTLCLLPLVVMEGLRVLKWAESCEGGHHQTHKDEEEENNNQNNNQNDDSTTHKEKKKKNLTQDPLVPLSMEPMWILLSGDVYSPSSPPTLLQVWRNMESSVSALEAGLSAARCVQTTAVAVDFCGNLASLAHLGVEVSQQGWQHGLAVMAQELIHLHVENNRGNKIRYTAAAVQAVRNGQIVAQNLHQMMQDDDIHPAIEPVVHVLTAIAGRGWLWGTNEPPPPPQQESTVKIEIIDDDANEAQEPNGRPIPVVSSNMGVQPSDRLVVDDQLRPIRQDSRESPTEAVESPATPGLLDEPSLSQSQCDELISVHDASTEEEEQEEDDDDDDDDNDNDVGSRSWEATVEEEIRVREGVAFSAHGRSTSSSTPPTTTTQVEQDGTEDWAKWVGGGLAVLGAAVVGGVALAHSASGGDARGGDQSSNVVIEELDDNATTTNDDLDEDEWISVSTNYE